MQDDISDIKAMVEADLEREENRLVRHQLEYDLTWRTLDAATSLYSIRPQGE